MFQLNEDMSINVTRGDAIQFFVSAADGDKAYEFVPSDVIRFKVFAKKDCASVVLQKDFLVAMHTELVEIYLSSKDTKIGEIISKPVDYWYEIELNPDTDSKTIVGYDEDGAKIFRLYPEGKDVQEGEEIETESV